MSAAALRREKVLEFLQDHEYLCDAYYVALNIGMRQVMVEQALRQLANRGEVYRVEYADGFVQYMAITEDDEPQELHVMRRW